MAQLGNFIKSVCIGKYFQPIIRTYRQRTVHSAARSLTYHLEAVTDRYKGFHIDLDSLPENITSTQFDKSLTEHLREWELKDPTSIWIKVPINRSHLIPVLAREGFLYHHAEGDSAMLCQWMKKNDISLLPQFATHQIGVAGCVVNEDTREVLVIKEKNRKFSLWKFPGGLSDIGEDMCDTAEREVYEETGVKCDFKGILLFRQQHEQPGAFGRSDLFFVCHMKPLTFELSPCSTEIAACQWMHIDELADCMSQSAITLRVIQLVKHGCDRGFDEVQLSHTEYESIYLGMQYKLYSRHVPELPPITNYLKNVTEMKDRVNKVK